MIEETAQVGILVERIDALREVMSVKLDSVHQEVRDVKSQAIYANKRVTNLEKWRNMFIGALVITELLILPIVLTFIVNWINKR